jgi:hypothetical protein
VADPIEEYPLPEPSGCEADRKPRDPAWHYCRLSGLIRVESFFAKGR